MHIFTGCWQGLWSLPLEVEAYAWPTLDTVQADAVDNPERYTAWFRLYLQHAEIATAALRATP